MEIMAVICRFQLNFTLLLLKKKTKKKLEKRSILQVRKRMRLNLQKI